MKHRLFYFHHGRANRLLLISVTILVLAYFSPESTYAQQQAGKKIHDMLSAQEASAAIEVAASAGDEPALIDALDHSYMTVLSQALKAVKQRRVKGAMPKLIAMFEWLNTINGELYTGSGPQWDMHLADSTIEMRAEVVAAIDAIANGAIPKPKDQSQIESIRYVGDVKAWWQASGQ